MTGDDEKRGSPAIAELPAGTPRRERYWLAIAPVDITYGDLIRHMRGSLALVPCASRYAHEKCKNCVEEGECRTRALLLDVRDRTAQLLDAIRLSDPIAPAPPFAQESDPA